MGAPSAGWSDGSRRRSASSSNAQARSQTQERRRRDVLFLLGMRWCSPPSLVAVVHQGQGRHRSSRCPERSSASPATSSHAGAAAQPGGRARAEGDPHARPSRRSRRLRPVPRSGARRRSRSPAGQPSASRSDGYGRTATTYRRRRLRRGRSIAPGRRQLLTAPTAPTAPSGPRRLDRWQACPELAGRPRWHPGRARMPSISAREAGLGRLPAHDPGCRQCHPGGSPAVTPSGSAALLVECETARAGGAGRAAARFPPIAHAGFLHDAEKEYAGGGPHHGARRRRTRSSDHRTRRRRPCRRGCVAWRRRRRSCAAISSTACAPARQTYAEDLLGGDGGRLRAAGRRCRLPRRHHGRPSPTHGRRPAGRARAHPERPHDDAVAVPSAGSAWQHALATLRRTDAGEEPVPPPLLP